ncbi:methyl-galactoside transport system substrate-binding protein [Paenibacillus anaericanus]|nr:methyl-galactoside transport system substrate-binding protein [Paenibacillus anaericanus]
MKKITTVGMTIALLATMIVGCSSDGNSVSGRDGGSTPKVGVAIYKFGDTFMKGVRKSFEKNSEGIAKLDIVDSENSQPKQNDQIDVFISKKVGALIINPVDRTAAGVIIDKAKASGTPVVFLNREPHAEDMKKWDKVYYVGAKAEQSGTFSGEIIAQYWKTHPEADKNGDGVLQYAMLKGEPGHQDAELRTRYSIQAVEDAGIRVEKVQEDTAMWERDKAKEKMASFLAAKGDKIEAVFANNDDMALGAIEALEDAGYFSGDKYMPVVGVDATAPALKALEQGTMLGTVLNHAENQGIAAVKLASLLAKGAEINKDTVGFEISDQQYIWIPYQKVTKENAANFK